MPTPDHYDVVVLGSGESGKYICVGRRNYRHRASRDVGRSALHRFEGHHIYTSDDVGRPDSIVLGGFAQEMISQILNSIIF
jgi:hypothetical protein